MENYITLSFGSSTVYGPEDVENPMTIAELIKELQYLIEFEGVSEDTPVLWHEPQTYCPQYSDVRIDVHYADEEED